MAKQESKSKARRPTAAKREIQNGKRRLRNKSFKSSIRTAIRRFEEAAAKGDAAITQEKLNTAYSLMDKAVKKNIVKLNKAGRIKSRMSKRLLATA